MGWGCSCRDADAALVPHGVAKRESQAVNLPVNIHHHPHLLYGTNGGNELSPKSDWPRPKR